MRFLAISSRTRAHLSLALALLLTACAAAAGPPTAIARATATTETPMPAPAEVPTPAASSCRFVLGFAALASALSQQVGRCTEDEQHDPVTGDAVQHTTGGLLVWRRVDNWTAFTDGYHTWVNGPHGIERRLNTERFAWEANPTGLPVVAAAPAVAPPAVTTAAPTAPQPTPTPASTAAGAPSHIIVIVMENKEAGEIIGSADAPYLTSLAARYTIAEHSYAITHPSVPNYLALLGGDTFGVASDCTSCFVDQPNLVDELEARGKTWRAYMEDLPRPCFLGSASGAYALKHDPFLYFRDVRDNPARCGRVVPFSQFTGDLASGTVPSFAWVTPNLQHDMHDGSVADGDRWLAGFVPPVLASDAWRRDGLLVITWDEGESDAGCCGLASGGRIPTLVVSPSGAPGARIETPVTHYSLLRTIEDAWGLAHLGHTGDSGVSPLLVHASPAHPAATSAWTSARR